MALSPELTVGACSSLPGGRGSGRSGAERRLERFTESGQKLILIDFTFITIAKLKRGKYICLQAHWLNDRQGGWEELWASIHPLGRAHGGPCANASWRGFLLLTGGVWLYRASSDAQSPGMQLGVHGRPGSPGSPPLSHLALRLPLAWDGLAHARWTKTESPLS